jgi:hypothetical protein
VPAATDSMPRRPGLAGMAPHGCKVRENASPASPSGTPPPHSMRAGPSGPLFAERPRFALSPGRIVPPVPLGIRPCPLRPVPHDRGPSPRPPCGSNLQSHAGAGHGWLGQVSLARRRGALHENARPAIADRETRCTTGKRANGDRRDTEPRSRGVNLVVTDCCITCYARKGRSPASCFPKPGGTTASLVPSSRDDSRQSAPRSIHDRPTPIHHP